MSRAPHQNALSGFLSDIQNRFCDYVLPNCQEEKTFLSMKGTRTNQRLIINVHSLCSYLGRRCDRFFFYRHRNELLVLIIELKGQKPEITKTENQLQGCRTCIITKLGDEIDSLRQRGIRIRIGFIAVYTSRNISVPSTLSNLEIELKGKFFRVIPARCGTPIKNYYQYCREWPI